MTTRAPLLAALCVLAATGGCGDDDGPPSSKQLPAADTTTSETAAATAPTLAPEDKRGAILACIGAKGIDARVVGEKGIQIGPGSDGPRIDFYQSSLEAEGEQFKGSAEGAQQIGAALLYVRDAPEQQLADLEACVNEQ